MQVKLKVKFFPNSFRPFTNNGRFQQLHRLKKKNKKFILESNTFARKRL